MPHPGVGLKIKLARRSLGYRLGRIERGTVVVLLIDFFAAMGVMTAGLLYARVNPVYLGIFSTLTFALFLLVWGLLLKSKTS